MRLFATYVIRPKFFPNFFDTQFLARKTAL